MPTGVYQTDWLRSRPATILRMVDSVFIIPEFDAVGVQWIGASENVFQINASADRDFVLLRRPNKPADATFVPVIRYRIGESVYRYRLWNDDNLMVGAETCPLYNGEKIKKNFVIEIWNLGTEGTVLNSTVEVENTTAITLETSIREYPSDFRDLDDTEIEGDTVNNEDLLNTNVFPIPAPSYIQPYFISTAGVEGAGVGQAVTFWRDQSILAKDIGSSGTAGKPIHDGSESDLSNKPALDFTGGSKTIQRSTADVTVTQGWLLFKHTSWTNGHDILKIQSGGQGLLIEQAAGTPDITITVDGIGSVVIDSAVLDTYYILEYHIDNSDLVDAVLRAKLYDLDGVLLEEENLVGSGLQAFVNSTIVIGPALTKIAALILTNSTAVSADVVSYLLSIYKLAMSLPLVFSASGPWLDNTADVD